MVKIKDFENFRKIEDFWKELQNIYFVENLLDGVDFSYT